MLAQSESSLKIEGRPYLFVYISDNNNAYFRRLQARDASSSPSSSGFLSYQSGRLPSRHGRRGGGGGGGGGAEELFSSRKGMLGSARRDGGGGGKVGYV